MENNVVNVNMPGIECMGVKRTIKQTNGDVIETRTGSFTYKYIDSFYVVIEDELAKKVIEIIACDCDNLPRKYIYSGVWGNQAACLFGFLLYADKLKGSNVPPFSIIAIDDGDVPSSAKDKRMNGLLKGNFVGEELENIKKSLSDRLLSFQLEYLNDNVKKGVPEYNHKKWFEEITKDMILSKEMPSNQYEYRQIESILEIIEFSKSIQLEDFHEYYSMLSNFSPKNTINEFHRVEYFVLNAIRKYNSSKWDYYTGNIKTALIHLDKENSNNFIKADMYFER
jgi:hypothetical protein